MKKIAFSLLALVTVVACSGESVDPGFDSTVPTGGTDNLDTGGSTSFSGGATSTGGSTTITGGASNSGGGGGTGGSVPTSGVTEIVSAELWSQLFPNRNAIFSYEAFVTAASLYPAFGTSGTDEMNRREVAAFFANIAHETTGGWEGAPGGRYAWGLHFKEEVGCESGCPQYSIGDADYPCTPGKSYHGRGPIQISQCYNYGPAGEHIGVDLLSQPELVSNDGSIAFRTALWFWMNGTSGGKPTAHAAIHGTGGFGGTIYVINGIECGTNSEKIQSRINHYKHFVPLLGATEGTPLSC